MKSFELQPTKDNILLTFEEDLLSRNADLLYFTTLLNALGSSYSIALDAAWGAGKTFFVKQAKMVLDAFNDHVTSEYDEVKGRIKAAWKRIRGSDKLDLLPQVSVYYDAWINDNDEDPILSLVYTILQTVRSEYDFKRGPECINVAASIIEVISGRSVTSAIEALKRQDSLALLREQKDIHLQVEEFFESLLAEQGNRLIIFIDELDRCKPTFAVRLLERIKHYFTNDRVTFVFSVNVSELQHTIKRYYGDEFDSSRYFNRFFDLRISLPPANISAFYHSIGLDNQPLVYDRICSAVIEVNQFSLREIAEFYRLAKTATGRLMRNEVHAELSEQFCIVCMVPVIIGLRICDQTKYEDFVNGRDCEPLLNVFMDRNIAISLCGQLLDTDETYDVDFASNGRRLAKREDKLKQAYDAVFVQEYSSKICYRRVGQITFTKESLEVVQRVVSGLSIYADYS